MNHYAHLLPTASNHAKEWRLLPATEGWIDFSHMLPRNITKEELDEVEKHYLHVHALTAVEPITK